MPDIDVDYDTIDQVATLLTNAYNNISPQINSLHKHVDNLLMKDGGLWMRQTSPAIQAQYEQFNQAATNCVQAIQSFSAMFSQLRGNLQSIDTQMATAIKHPSGS